MPWFQQQLLADGVTAEGRVVTPKAILEAIINDHIATIAVNVGGTGYVVGEEFDIVGGTAVALNGVNFVARGRVTTEVAGVVTGVELLSVGAYTIAPGTTGLATTNATLAGNDDLTLDVTIGSPLWTQDESDYVDLLTNFSWLASSTKALNPPTIGFQSQQSGANDGMRIVVATGYDNGSTWLTQPGAPPTNRFYMAVPNQDPLIYISHTERRVNVLVTDGTFKQYAGAGLFIPFVDIDANWPFPGIVHAQSQSVIAFNSTYSSSNAGIVNAASFTGLGMYQYRNNISADWLGIEGDNSIGADNDAVIWPNLDDDARYDFNRAPIPAGSGVSTNDMSPFASNQPTGSFQDDDPAGGWFNVDESGNGAQGPAPLGIANQLHFSMPAHIIRNQTDNAQLIGVVDGFEHLHGRGLDAFDEIETPDGRRYLTFQDSNAAQLYRWVAMEKL